MIQARAQLSLLLLFLGCSSSGGAADDAATRRDGMASEGPVGRDVGDGEDGAVDGSDRCAPPNTVSARIGEEPPFAVGAEVLGADMWVGESGPRLLALTVGERVTVTVAYRDHWISQGGVPALNGRMGVAGVSDPWGDTVWLWPWHECPFAQLSGSDLLCTPMDSLTETFVVAAAHLYGPDSAWIVGDPGDGTTELIQHDNGQHIASHRCDGMADPIEVWGDPVAAMALSRDAVCMVEYGGLARLLDAPPGPYVGLWARDRGAISVATADGRILRFDGATWTSEDTGLGAIEHVAMTASGVALAGPRTIWHRQGPYTSRLRRWEEQSIRVLAVAAHGDDIHAIIHDAATPTPECQPTHLVSFVDGQEQRFY